MKFSKSKKEMLLKVLFLLPVSLLAVTPAFAAIDVGKNTGTWLTDNVNGLIPGLLAAIALLLLVKRDWPKALSLFGLALMIAVLLNWEKMKSISTLVLNVILGS